MLLNDAQLFRLKVPILSLNRSVCICADAAALIGFDPLLTRSVCRCPRRRSGRNDLLDEAFSAHDHAVCVCAFEAVDSQQAFEFLLGLLPAALLVLADQLRALQLAHRVAKDHIVELQLLCLFLPGRDLGYVKLVLSDEQLVTLLKLVERGDHVDALAFVDAERGLEHFDFLVFFHLEVEVGALLFVLGHLSLHLHHVVLVGHNKVSLVLLHDGGVERVQILQNSVDLLVGLLYVIGCCNQMVQASAFGYLMCGVAMTVLPL